jgi:hypothetical protein
MLSQIDGFVYSLTETTRITIPTYVDLFITIISTVNVKLLNLFFFKWICTFDTDQTDIIYTMMNNFILTLTFYIDKLKLSKARLNLPQIRRMITSVDVFKFKISPFLLKC